VRRPLVGDLNPDQLTGAEWATGAMNLISGLNNLAKQTGNPHAYLLRPHPSLMSAHQPITPSTALLAPAPPNTGTHPAAMKGVHPPKWTSDVNDFFGRMELYFTLTGTPRHQWIAAALLNIPLHHVSQRWFTHTQANSTKQYSWPEFKEQIIIYTRGHSAKNRALAELAACTQGSSSIDGYISRYATLVSQAAQDITAPHIIEGFLRGMTDHNLRTILTVAPTGLPWTNLMALQNHASILSVARYGSRNKNTHTPAHSNPRPFNKRKLGAGVPDTVTVHRTHPAYGKTRAERSLHTANNALNSLRDELLSAAGRNNKPRPPNPNNGAGSSRGGGGGGGSGGGRGGGGGGRSGGRFGGMGYGAYQHGNSNKRRAEGPADK
jgi:uncharacterized membrane protein YgcG